MRIDPDRLDPFTVTICVELQSRGHDAYLVGGAVRDLLRRGTPSDWDVATSALPVQVMEAFPGSIPTGIEFGTVTILRDGRQVEVTTFRAEGRYSDGRHPDEVSFGRNIEDDLARRDFTVNAMAYDPVSGRLVDPFHGRLDLKRRLLRTVGPPDARFAEDALRMVRLYRFAATLGLRPSRDSVLAVRPESLVRVSRERIRDELSKILLAPFPMAGLSGLASSGLMGRIVPEMRYDDPLDLHVFRHSLRTVEAIAPSLHLRLSALLHDIGKPSTRVEVEGETHFYGHDEAGSGMAREALCRLRYPGDLVETVTRLVRLHMFQIPRNASEAAWRRLLQKAGGPDSLRDLVELRRADIVATDGTYWRAAGAWRELRERVEEMLAEENAFRLSDLAVNGEDVMRILGIEPGPEVGRVLRYLLELVLENPSLNTRDGLEAVLREHAP